MERDRIAAEAGGEGGVGPFWPPILDWLFEPERRAPGMAGDG